MQTRLVKLLNAANPLLTGHWRWNAEGHAKPFDAPSLYKCRSFKHIESNTVLIMYVVFSLLGTLLGYKYS